MTVFGGTTRARKSVGGHLYVWQNGNVENWHSHTVPALNRRELWKPCSHQCQQRAHFLTEMKKKEMSFNPHPLLYAENKGSFQFKWSIQETERVREKQTGRKRESGLGLGAILSLIVLWDCPTARAQWCQLLRGERPAERCLLAAALGRFEAT